MEQARGQARRQDTGPYTAHRAGRAASLALAVVLAFITGFALWAAITTNRVAGQTKQASALSDAYQQARYAIGAEESLERKYRLEPGPSVRASHHAAAATLAETLEQVRRDGNASDRVLADEANAQHARYLDAINRLFAAVDNGDTALAQSIDTDEVDPSFGAFERRVADASEARHAEALNQLDTLARTERLVFLLTPLVFAVGLSLVGASWAVMRQFQRRIDEAVRSEATRLAALNAELESQAARLREHTAELAATNEKLQRKNEENEAFVYSVSHDLRSPLVNLQGFSEELALAGEDLHALLADPGVPPAVRARGAALLDDDMAPALDFIRTGVTRLSGIIDALLRLSRVGQVVYQREPVDPAPIIARIVASLNETPEGPQATIAVGPLPTLCGDPSAVEQIFGNLIGNALKYRDPQRPGRIEIGCLDPGDADADGQAEQRTYYVRDNGLGISAHGLAKVFQPFQRLHPHVATGDGLGLAFVRRVVDRLEGRLWVESIPGAGSTFYVALPATDAATVAVPTLPECEFAHAGASRAARMETPA